MKNRTVNRILATALAVMMSGALAACGQQSTSSTAASTAAAEEASTEAAERADTEAAEEAVDGGWETPATPALTEDAKNALTKALEGLTGATYTPVALLGTQTVSGTNYRILCRMEMVVPDATETWAVVTVYEDLDGNATLTDVTDSGVATDLPDESDGEMTGAWEAEESPVLTDEEKTLFAKALESSDTSYTPIAILSHQIVSGENYCFLAVREEDTGADPDSTLCTVTLYEDLDGNVTVSAITPFAAEDSGSQADTAEDADASDAGTSDTAADSSTAAATESTLSAE